METQAVGSVNVNTKGRLTWMDNVKALGIISVVLAHTSIPNPLFFYIFAFHMPLFFFLSGYLFSKGKYKNFGGFLLKRIRSIVIPYFIFAFVAYAMGASTDYWLFKHGMKQDFSINIKQGIHGIIYSYGNIIPYDVALWFLTCLFITEIMFYFLSFIKKDWILVVALIVMSIIGFKLGDWAALKPDNRLPWSIDIAFTAIAFYGAGYLFKKHSLIDKMAKHSKLLLHLFLFTSIIFTYLNPGRTDLNNLKYYNYFYCYIAAFSGILCWILVSTYIKPNKILSFIGKNSIYLLAFQFPAFTYFYNFVGIVYCGMLHHQWPQGYTLSFINTFYVVVVVMGITYLIQKLVGLTKSKIVPSHTKAA